MKREERVCGDVFVLCFVLVSLCLDRFGCSTRTTKGKDAKPTEMQRSGREEGQGGEEVGGLSLGAQYGFFCDIREKDMGGNSGEFGLSLAPTRRQRNVNIREHIMYPVHA